MGAYPFRPWRAGQDLNLLPPAVLAGALPKAPPARVAATVCGNLPNHLGFFCFWGRSMYVSRLSIRWSRRFKITI